jgi:hypothetical protein
MFSSRLQMEEGTNGLGGMDSEYVRKSSLFEDSKYPHTHPSRHTISFNITTMKEYLCNLV